MELDITYGVVWYQIALGNAPGEGKLRYQKTTWKATGKHLALFFPRHVMECAIGLKGNGINEAQAPAKFHFSCEHVRVVDCGSV